MDEAAEKRESLGAQTLAAGSGAIENRKEMRQESTC